MSAQTRRIISFELLADLSSAFQASEHMGRASGLCHRDWHKQGSKKDEYQRRDGKHDQ